MSVGSGGNWLCKETLFFKTQPLIVSQDFGGLSEQFLLLCRRLNVHFLKVGGSNV